MVLVRQDQVFSAAAMQIFWITAPLQQTHHLRYPCGLRGSLPVAHMAISDGKFAAKVAAAQLASAEEAAEKAAQRTGFLQAS